MSDNSTSHLNKGFHKNTWRLFLLLAGWGILVTNCYAADDSVYTVYRDGKFYTHCKMHISASKEVTAGITDELVHQFHYSPDNLFNWALKGLGLQGEKDKELKIVLKSSTYNEKDGITRGYVDVVVPNITTFNDVEVDAHVVKSENSSGTQKVTANVLNSNLLHAASGTFTIIPIGNNEQMIISDLTIKFGWFFNIFITQKRYKNIVEWRVKKFTENIKSEAEKREKNKN